MALLQNISRCMKSSCVITLFFLSYFFCPAIVAGPLHDAVKKNNLQQVEKLISQGHSVEESYEGLPPLFIAAEEWHLEMVKLLLKHKANPDVTAEKYDSWTPLIFFAYHNKHEMVDALLQHGANVNSLGDDGYSAMAWAWDEGQMDIVKTLIKQGADPNAAPIKSKRTGMTFLHLAIRKNEVEITKLLLERGANINVISESGGPLQCSKMTSIELVKLLVKYGIDFKRQGKDGCIPLQSAVSGGVVEVVQFFLDHGADTDINVKDRWGGSALYDAVKDEHFEIAKLLLKRGANANIQNNYGFTPLHRAARKGYTDLVRSLLKHGADGNIKGTVFTIRGYLAVGSSPGYTPLHAAVEGGVLEIVQMLIEHGADVNAEAFVRIFTKEEIIRHYEKTPLDLAILYEKHVPGTRKAIVEFLSRYHQKQHGEKRKGQKEESIDEWDD